MLAPQGQLASRKVTATAIPVVLLTHTQSIPVGDVITCALHCCNNPSQNCEGAVDYTSAYESFETFKQFETSMAKENMHFRKVLALCKLSEVSLFCLGKIETSKSALRGL